MRNGRNGLQPRTLAPNITNSRDGAHSGHWIGCQNLRYLDEMQLAKVALALVLAVGAAACDAPLHPETPPLLEGASVGKEYFSPCPPDASFDWKVSSSQAFEARLKELVSRDSSEETLIRALTGQGFRLENPPCATDPAVRSSMFIQSGGGFTSFPILATAYWRVNADNRIEWIHGNVAFTGP